jgi:LuxR family maltose regulon positive regulatory protein
MLHVGPAAPLRASMNCMILASKLHPPQTSSAQVTRERVTQLVSAAATAKMVLVRAPAGFGKTTVMVQCRAQLQQRGVDAAWLTLDSADNDPSRFLASLDAAVAQITGNENGTDETAWTFGGALGDKALGIMERLASHGAPFALMLDDFECIQELTVLELVRELLDQLPRGGQLIIGSRALPDLGLGRLRARGQLLEIDAAQLRFSMDETAEFFTQRRAIPLSADHVAQLHGKTEGWIAALWLASVSLERVEDRAAFIERFSGSHEAVADYLANDVLLRQPPDVRRFLLHTSILRHLDPALCDALLGRGDSAAVLAQLAAANLFLVPLEAAEKTYRYHSLFAGFLRGQLVADEPAALVGLHRLASQWYEQHTRPVPAIDHALEGTDLEKALALLAVHGERLLEEGRMRLLTRWFDLIPAASLERLPLLQVIRIWALCFTRGPWEAMKQLSTSHCATSGDPLVQSYVLALRPSLHALMDDHEEAYRVGGEALSHLPLLNPFANSALANEMAYVSCFMGERAQSYELLEAARQRASFFNQMYSESIEGIIDLEEGRLRQATARFRMAVRSNHAGGRTNTNGNAFAGILYADALYEANDLEQAARLLHVYVPLARDVGLADHMIIGYLRLARIAFQRGDVDLLFECLAELEHVGHHRQLPRVVASARLERARIFLMQGNRQASVDELRRADVTAIWERVRALRMPAHDLEYLELGKLRWEIHFGDAAAAVPVLAAAIADASAQARHRRALKLRVLYFLALERSNDKRAALAGMTELLAATAQENFVRLIIDEGPLAASLVRRASAERQSDPIFSEYLQRVVEGFGAALDDAPEAPSVLDEPLTRREISVLLLLAEGYSNSAMAEKMFVADSTVRTHLRNINTKMGVHSRMQAVSNARRLGIIR